MPLYLIFIEEFDKQVMEGLDNVLKANALKSKPITKTQRVVQYGGGGAENLGKRIKEACGSIPKLSIFKIAPDYTLHDNPDAVIWLDDAARKSAF